MYLIEKLQEKILAKNTPTSEVLETAITIGNNENIQELIDWATLELNGYNDTTVEIPNYRDVSIFPTVERWAGDYFISEKYINNYVEHIRLGASELEQRIQEENFVLRSHSTGTTITQITLREANKEDLEKILYQIQQETLTRITKVKREMKQKQEQKANDYNINIKTGDNANIQGIGHDNVIHNYVTLEQKIDLQNQLNQLQELIKEYQENSDYEYVKGEISHIQKQLEHPPIEHKKIVGLWQYIPNLITGLSSGTASAIAIQLISYISKTLGC